MSEIYGKDQCPQCDMAKNMANAKGIQFNYKQLGTDFTREELLEQFPEAVLTHDSGYLMVDYSHPELQGVH